MGSGSQELAARWAEQLAAWEIPAAILAQAPDTPWRCPPEEFAVGTPGPVSTASAAIERAVVPDQGTVLDVGCGGGRASLSLVPTAARIIGVDQSAEMLRELHTAAERRGVAHELHEGRWPDVSAGVPGADVVVCHHVVYNVPDVVPFLEALTDHAGIAVVLELGARHPQALWTEAWRHFWGLERPAGPSADDLVAIVDALGWRPEVWRQPRSTADWPFADHARAVRSTCRRLCLPPARTDEVAEYLAAHPLRADDDLVTVRWYVADGGDAGHCVPVGS